MMRHAPTYLNLINMAVRPRETTIVNDVIRSNSLELAHYKQQDMIREAERSRLLDEALENKVSKTARFIRLPVGRAIVATGRRIQGRAATANPAGDGNPSAALELAR